MNSIKLYNRMDTIFMNSENSETSKDHLKDPHRLFLNVLNKINLKVTNMLLYQTLAFNINEKNIKMSYKNNEFKLSAPTLNAEFELLDGSYSVSDFEGYFQYILQKHKIITYNPSVMIFVIKIEK